MCDRAGWLAGGGAIIGIGALVLSCSDRLATAALPATSLGGGASLLAPGGAPLLLPLASPPDVSRVGCEPAGCRRRPALARMASTPAARRAGTRDRGAQRRASALR